MRHAIKTISLCICFLLTLSLGFQSKASHQMGMDLQYVCVDSTHYVFTLNFYRDCAGIPAPTTTWIKVSSTCWGTSCLELPSDGNGGIEVSPLCLAQITNSTCNGGTLPGVEIYTFTDTLVIGAGDTCNDWTIGAFHLNSSCNTASITCCRNQAITNLTLPQNQNQYITMDMKNKGGLCNSSPNFTSLPTPFICINEPFNYNHGAVDPDGDSLVYLLTTALGDFAPGGNLSYSGSYTYSSPLSSSPVLNLDSITGQLTMTPNLIQQAVISMIVQEWRTINGVDSLIGTSMRDLQIIVMNCTNKQPKIPETGIDTVINGIKIDSFTVTVCVGDSLVFTFIAIDTPNLDNITVITNVSSTIPAATISLTAPSFSVTGTFSWRPTQADVGYNGFVATVQDDGCPVLGAQWYVFNVIVLDGLYAGPDKVSCDGDSVQLTTTGGSSWIWTPTSGLSCSTCQSPMAAPVVTTSYIVSSNFSGNCKTTDTVIVTAATGFATSTSPDTTICQNSVGLISATGDGSYSSYTYSWSPSDSLVSTTDSSSLANPISTTVYTVIIEAPSGCWEIDSVTVTIAGVAPNISAFADPTNLCLGSGDSSQLDVNTTGLCGVRSCAATITQYIPTDTTSGTAYAAPFYYDASNPYHEQYLY
ncbi:MAG: hypothetical protein IH946_02850, partial [Bacteroidetes bacterium]|nr:hypothetical protein [Bacteroidota bacterium]